MAESRSAATSPSAARSARACGAFGFDVTAIERSPALAAMLRWALDRAQSDGRVRNAIEGRLRLVQGDAREILPSMKPRPDAVYLDPMFPPRRKKSALAKKSIRIVRALVGDDPDAAELLSIALAHARERVVVKRLDDAPPLMPGPIASITGTTVRYDVYRAGVSRGTAQTSRD
jgi:16S rRNA (guanine1516-N2)-methyltransferase